MSDMVGNPEDRFSRVEAHMNVILLAEMGGREQQQLADMAKLVAWMCLLRYKSIIKVSFEREL